jgi:hypothetical protein
MKSFKTPLSFSIFSRICVRRLFFSRIFLGLILGFAASLHAYALGPDLYVHSECQFCASTYDTTTVTVNLQLGGGPYVDGHYAVRQCDNNGFNCHNHDFTITNNAITSGRLTPCSSPSSATPEGR